MIISFQAIKKAIYIIAFSLTSLLSNGQELYFDVIGTWNYNIPTTNILEAGNDFTGSYSSANNQINVSVYLDGGWIGFWWNWFINYSWQIEVSRMDTDWHPDLEIYIRRTGDGAGYGGGNYVSGGNNYMPVKNENQRFYEGGRARMDVPVQYMIRNVSVTMPAKTYSTTIVYTVTSTF